MMPGGEQSRGNGDAGVSVDNESIRPFTYRKNAISSDTSDEYIEATIDFSDGGPDASSQRTLSNHSAEDVHRPSSDDESNLVCEVASGSELRSTSAPIASTSSLVSSASTSASSFYPAFNPIISNDSIRNLRNDNLSAYDVYYTRGGLDNYGAKFMVPKHNGSSNVERAQQGTPTLIEISAAQRQNDRTLRDELPLLSQDAKNKKASNTALESKGGNIATEIPFRQILQTASTMTNPEKLKSLHRENAFLRRHLDEANNYADTVEIENEQNFTTLSNKIDDLYDALDEKNRQLNMANLRLNEKEQEISKLQERIGILEKSNQRQQQVIEVTREEANREKEKLREAAKERAELLLRNASLFHQKREWSIERERLSMELNDVTRELDLQRMLLNGESISEIVRRWESKVFDLEGMIADRDAAIRAQQQRIGELKHYGARGGGELSSNESISSQNAVSRGDPGALAHLKRILLQYLANPTEEQYAQLLQSISNVLHLSSDDNFALVEHMKRHMLRHPSSHALR